MQDLYDLSTALTGNLHELLELVKGLAHKVLAPSAAASAATKQLLPELAGESPVLSDATCGLALTQHTTKRSAEKGHQRKPSCPSPMVCICIEPGCMPLKEPM